MYENLSINLFQLFFQISISQYWLGIRLGNKLNYLCLA